MAAATVTTHIAAGGKNISNGNSVCMTQAQAMETDVVALEVRLVGVRTTATTSAMLTSQTRDPITTEVETISTPSPPPVVDAVCCNKEQLLKKANENDIVPEIVSTEVALLAATIFIDSSTQTESDSETERGLTVIIEEETDFEIAETVESKKQENDEDFSINDSKIGLTCDAIIDANDRISEQSEVANLEVNINIDKHEKKEEDSDDEDDDDDVIEDDDGGEEECYTYKERIIDFDNLRIIEHVIDNHCKVKRKHNKKGKLQDNLVDSDSKSKLIDCAIAIENSEKEETVECGGSKMHNSGNSGSENVFACRELVAFIDESYSVIDNARAYESNRENGIDIETFDMKKSKTGCVQTGVKQNFNSNDDNNEKDHYNYNHNVEIVDNDANIDVQDGLEFTSSLQIVDDNNNMRDNNTNSNAENDGSTNGNAVFGLANQNSRNCDRTACPNDVNSTEKVFQMTLDRENVTKVQKNLEFELDCEHQTVPIGVGATLKAFKSKLTPSAPPFEPAASRIKLNATATSAAATAGLYAAYEQTTTIYYKQQNQIQQNQQQQQQQQLQQTKLNQAQQLVKQSSMLHAYSLSQKKKLIPTQQTHHYQHQQHQPHQPHQHQQHMLIAQAAHQQQQQQKQHASKQQHQKHHQQQLTAREYCAQHNSNVAAITTHTGAGTIPHLHVHAPGTAAAISTANNTAAHATHLLPLQLISLTTQQTTGVPTGIWPLVEAPFYIDTNGEFRTYCPAHGPPVPVPAPAPPANTSAPLLSITPANSSTTNITAVQPHSLPTLLVTQHQHQKHQNHQQTQQIGQHQQQNQQQVQHHQQIQNQQQIYTSSPTATTEATRQLFLQLDNGVHNNSIPMPLLQQYQQPQQQQHQQQHIRAGKRGKVNRGPTAVQMVSQNRPAPMPVPVQVQQGQVMQQYVNESGTLTHVVLSPQQYQQLHAGQGHIHAPFLTTNGTSHFYSPLPAGFPTGPVDHKEIFQSTRHTGGPPHYHTMPSGHMQQQPPNQQASNQQPMSHSPHSPSPPNSYHKDERSQRQHTKLIRKLEKQREYNTGLSTPAHSPSPRRNELNGHHNHNTSSVATSQTTGNNNVNHHNNHHGHHQTPQHLNNYARRVTQRNGGASSTSLHLNSGGSSGGGGASSVGTSEDGEDTSSIAEDEEENQASIVEQLSAIQKPEVIDITSRSAKIIWEAPVISDPMLINSRALRYNVLLSDRAKDCKYKSLYKGESYDCIVQDLQPGQEYVVRVQVHYEKLQGTASDPTEFTTPPCEPDQPLPPKLVVRTKNSIQLRWTSPPMNGVPLQHYLLEYDEGKTGMPAARILRQHGSNAQLHFVEVTKTKSKQYTLSKLQPSTVYNFRLAAVNEVGPSTFSPICTYSTSGNPPTAPKPPALQVVTSTTLGLVWERRQQDGDFLLQMLDRESGHGFLNVYNGPECIYECCQLRRATTYSFRLRAENEAGTSPWSNEVIFKTAPERPGRPGKPHAKGKIHGTHFRARWEPPTDTGGADILRYFLEITSGSKFERIYTGPDPETTCDRLQPGTTYQLRASCEGPAGLSTFSDVAHITSEAIVPAAPPPPYYDNPPGPYAAVLRLDKPDYNGGAPVLEFEVQLRHITERRTEESAEPATLVYRGKDSYCVVKDLRPGQEYEVQTRSINRIGAGAWSSWFRFSAAAAPPYQPEMLRVVVKSATHLMVSWQEPDCNGAPIAEYRLESAAVSCETNEAATSSTTATPNQPASSSFQTCYQGLQTSADLRNLLPFTLYYFRVNACNVAGVSKWSSLVNAKTPAAVPTAPQIKDYEFTANDVTLRWTQPECNGAPITVYNIECADRTITTPDATTEYTIGNLTPETPYKFRVQAVNSVGSGAFSTNAKFTTLPLPPAPPTLECTGVGHNFIKLKWGDGRNSDFTKFYVEMYVSRAKEFQAVYSGTNNMCKINKLQERTAYTFRICAGNDRAGVGDYSEEYIFNTSASLPSGIKAPRIAQDSNVCLLGAHGNNTNNASSTSSNYIPSGMLSETPTSFIAGLGNLSLGVPVTLEWQHSKNSFSDRVDYVLQYAIGKDSEFKKIYRGPETKFTIENLEPGATYQFRVCPIRVTSNGEELPGAYTAPFRYQVPQLLDEIDSSLLSSAAVNVLASANISSGIASPTSGSNNCSNNNSNNASAACHGHSHHAHHSHHMHHSHNHSHHSHHNSRHGGSSISMSTLHHRSVSASAASGPSNGNSSSRNNSDTSSFLFGNNAIGLIPLGTTLNNDLTTPFASCDDPHHHHHHHHHPFHAAATTVGSSDVSCGSMGTPTTTLLAAATSGLLSANSPLLLNAAAAAAGANAAASHHHHHHHAQNGVMRRFVTKLTSIYSNRKRFTDQEKAVMYMVLFLFLTFLFATLVKMFMR